MEWLIPSRHFSKGSVPLVSSSDCWRPQLSSAKSSWNGEKQQHHYSINVMLFKTLSLCLGCCFLKSACRSSTYLAARCGVLSEPPNSDQNFTAANKGWYLGFISRVHVFAALHPHTWPVCLTKCYLDSVDKDWPGAAKQMLNTKGYSLQLCHSEVERGQVGSDPEADCDWLSTKTEQAVKNKSGRLLCNK